ncbi:MAG: hypothetical protein EZS28_027051, partial [Streblomastix strix]
DKEKQMALLKQKNIELQEENDFYKGINNKQRQELEYEQKLRKDANVVISKVEKQYEQNIDQLKKDNQMLNEEKKKEQQMKDKLREGIQQKRDQLLEKDKETDQIEKEKEKEIERIIQEKKQEKDKLMQLKDKERQQREIEREELIEEKERILEQQQKEKKKQEKEFEKEKERMKQDFQNERQEIEKEIKYKEKELERQKEELKKEQNNAKEEVQKLKELQNRISNMEREKEIQQTKETKKDIQSQSSKQNFQPQELLIQPYVHLILIAAKYCDATHTLASQSLKLLSNQIKGINQNREIKKIVAQSKILSDLAYLVEFSPSTSESDQIFEVIDIIMKENKEATQQALENDQLCRAMILSIQLVGNEGQEKDKQKEIKREKEYRYGRDDKYHSQSPEPLQQKEQDQLYPSSLTYSQSQHSSFKRRDKLQTQTSITSLQQINNITRHHSSALARLSVNGTDEQRIKMVKWGIVPIYAAMLKHSNPLVVSDAVIAISNIVLA